MEVASLVEKERLTAGNYRFYSGLEPITFTSYRKPSPMHLPIHQLFKQRQTIKTSNMSIR